MTRGSKQNSTKPVAESYLYPWTKNLTNRVIVLLVRKSVKNVTFPRLHQSVTYKKKQLFANVIEHICDHNTELAKITMITYQNTAKKRCTTSFSNKKVTKNRNQNALKI
jgi:hypothetical protein